MVLKHKQKYFFLAAFVLFAFLVYWLPRFLVSTLGEGSPWISYIYTYSLGGFVFTLSLIRLYSLTEKTQKKQNTPWVLALCFGIFWGLLIHGLWILFSISFPFKG